MVGLSSRPGAATGDPFEILPLSNLVEIASDEHVPDRITLDVQIDESCDGAEPLVPRTPEFLHGLGNFISNAGQFARSAVTVRLYWTKNDVWISIHDDGPGFSNAVLQTLGEPYLSTRAGQNGHMGLGVFIATTLLERIGAETVFRNRKGAEILIRWPRRVLEVQGDAL